MPTSDEELQRKQERVTKLRAQVAAEEQKRVQRERELSNDVTAAQLDAEAARLEARLEVAKESNKVAAVKSGAAAPLEAAREEVKQAEAVRTAQAKVRETQEREAAKTADVNTESDTKES